MNEMPTYEEFLSKLYSLHPVGNAELYYGILEEKLGTKLRTGEVLTFELLIRRFSDYLSYLKPFNDIKDKQYIKKDKAIKPIGEYLLTDMFNDDYAGLIGTPNDNYLFGI